MKILAIIVLTLLAILTSPSAFAKNPWKIMYSAAPLLDDVINKHEDVAVKGVLPKSPAAKAGIRMGDVIVAIDENPVDSIKEAVDVLDSLNNRVPLLLKRGGISFRQNVLLNPRPPRLGITLYDEYEESARIDEKTKKKTTCQIRIGDIGLIANVAQSKDHYQVWLYLKNLGKKITAAPYAVMLQDSFSTMLRFMPPEEMIYFTYGSGGGTYIPPPQAITVLPSSYTLSATSRVRGNALITEGVISPNNQGLYSFQQGMNSLQQGLYSLAMRRAAQAAANRQRDEVWFNNNYLRRSEIPPDAVYQGVLFFAKSSNDAQGVKLTTYMDANKSGVCNFISESEEKKRKKHRK